MASSVDHIVITGVGLITPLGLSSETTWRAVRDGRCGVGPMSAMESPLPPGAGGGQAPDLPADFSSDLPREARYLRRAMLDALADAGAGALDSVPYPRHRCGVVLGTTLHGMRAGGRFFRTGDLGALKDFLAGGVLANAADGLACEGAAFTNCSACSSSLGSIALAMTLLRQGQLDLVVAGGYDTVSEYVYGGFNSLRLIAPGALTPFCRGRAGMKVAEGYGIVVLERSSSATARGATPLAQVLGYGESADAHHLTQPQPQGEGAARAIHQALQSAGLNPADIGLIAAHATGTPDNDAAEFAALARVFGPLLPQIPVVAFKSHLGHTLGGAGAVELILSALALRDQIAPACANVRPESVEFPGLQLVTGASRPAQISATLNTSLGFGGANTCVILGPVQSAAKTPATVRSSPADRDVFITGVATIFPGLIGNDALLQRLSQPVQAIKHDVGAVPDEQIASLLNARRVRRMSEYVKLSLASAMLCLADAGVSEPAAFLKDAAAAVLGTAHGATNYCEQYYQQIVSEGVAAANPMLFAEGVPNAAAAHLSLMLGLHGPCQTVIGSRAAGLDALRLAAARIAGGEWERAIVGAADEFSPVVNSAYGRWGLHGPGGFFAGAGAVSLLLESRASLESRGGRARGQVVAAAGGMSRGRGVARLVRRVIERIGSPPMLFGSSNGTWLDRAETAGARHAGREIISSLKGRIAECYSAVPLAQLAAALLTGRIGTGNLLVNAGSARDLGVVATDYAGGVSGVRARRIG